MLHGFGISFPLFMMLYRLCLRWSFKVVAGFIVLPSISLALTCSHHSYFVGSCASILTLKLNPLGASFVIYTPPLLRAPSAPVLSPITPSDPVGQYWQRQALPSTYQLFQGVYTGTLAI